jgi:hypothetical protein
MNRHDTMDVLTGFAVIAAMVLFFATAGALVEWWDTTWRIAVDPVRSEVYAARIHSPCLLHSWWWWRSAGCRMI